LTPSSLLWFAPPPTQVFFCCFFATFPEPLSFPPVVAVCCPLSHFGFSPNPCLNLGIFVPSLPGTITLAFFPQFLRFFLFSFSVSLAAFFSFDLQSSYPDFLRLPRGSPTPPPIPHVFPSSPFSFPPHTLTSPSGRLLGCSGVKNRFWIRQFLTFFFHPLFFPLSWFRCCAASVSSSSPLLY